MEAGTGPENGAKGKLGPVVHLFEAVYGVE
jgi:hypothetical protein